MEIREYQSSDCQEIAQLFYDTVHSINAKDYSTDQLNAWATGVIDIDLWDKSFLEHYTIVTVEDKIITGFGDIDQAGYLDRLYVHKDYQHIGIATAICNELENYIFKKKITHISTHASITAKPFFEKRGYTVIKKNQVRRNGQELTNYTMKKNAHLI